MHVGVTGASGFVGSHLIEALAKEGHSVRILVRKTSIVDNLKGLSYSPVFGDILDQSSLNSFVSDLDVVIHCAALTVGSRRALHNANVTGTSNLLSAIQTVNPTIKRFIHISSQEVAGCNPDKKSLRRENDPLLPITNYGVSKLRAEDLVRAASGWLSWTILRPSPVYGPRDKDTFIFFQAAATRLKPVAFFPGRFSLVYVGNLVNSIVQSIHSPKANQKTYYIADSPVLTWTKLTKMLESLAGRRRLALPIAKPLLFVISSISTAWCFVTGTRAILNRQKYLMLTAENLSVDSGEALRDLGQFENIPQKEAMKVTLEWYREAHWV